MYSLTFNVIKIKEEEKDHTDTAPYRLFINSKAINQKQTKTFAANWQKGLPSNI